MNNTEISIFSITLFIMAIVSIIIISTICFKKHIYKKDYPEKTQRLMILFGIVYDILVMIFLILYLAAL